MFHAPENFCGVHRVWMSITWGKGKCGRIEIELDADATPDAAYNFAMLCSGERGLAPLSSSPLHYKNTCFHRICKGNFVQGGDIEFNDGSGGDSVFGGCFLAEAKGLEKSHNAPGIVSMGHLGDPNSQSSQFFITCKPQHDLDGDHTIVGKVVKGMEHVLAASNVEVDEDNDDRPIEDCKITDCGWDR